MNKSELKPVYTTVKKTFVSLVDNHLSPDYHNRCSSLVPHELATVLADCVLGSTEKTRQWIKRYAQGMNIVGNPCKASLSPFMAAVFIILENICGVSLPSLIKEKLPPLNVVMQHLLFPYGRNTSYVLPLHLACLALVSALKGQRTPHVITMIQDLQQKDGSWTDDTIITALCALALSQSSIQPKYDVKTTMVDGALSRILLVLFPTRQ